MIGISKLTTMFTVVRKFFMWCLEAVLRPCYGCPYVGPKVTRLLRTVKGLPTTELHRLPDELLLRVFSHLQPAERSVVCMSVCRRWRRVARDESLWRELKFNNYFSACKMKTYLQLPFVRNVVRSLQLTQHHHRLPNVRIPNLETLLIVLNFHFLLDLTKKNENGKIYRYARKIVENYPSLLILKMSSSSCIHLAESHIFAICEFFKTLKDLKSNLQLQIEGLTLLISNDESWEESLPKLRTIKTVCSVKQIQLAIWDFSAISRELQELACIFSEVNALSVFHDCLDSLSTFSSSKLTRLRLWGPTKVEAFKTIPDTCSQLQMYRLEESLTGDFPSSISPLLNLEVLDIVKARELTDAEILKVLGVWRKLKVLSVQFTNCSKNHLEAITKENTTLTKLSIHSERSVSESNDEMNNAVEHISASFDEVDNSLSEDDGNSEADSADSSDDDDYDSDDSDDDDMTEPGNPAKSEREKSKISFRSLRKLETDSNFTKLISDCVDLHVPTCSTVHFAYNRYSSEPYREYTGFAPRAPSWKLALCSHKRRQIRQNLLEKLNKTCPVQTVHLSAELMSYDELLFWTQTCSRLTKVKFVVRNDHADQWVTTGLGRTVKLRRALVDTLEPLTNLEKCVVEMGYPGRPLDPLITLAGSSRVYLGFPKHILQSFVDLGLKSAPGPSIWFYKSRKSSWGS